MSPQIRETVLVIAALAAVAVSVALLQVVPGVNPTTAGFMLLMLVLLTATRAPIWIAVTVAVGCTLSFNYFFFPPVGTFSIAETHNWVSLGAFLLTAILGSQLSSAAQERARSAVERAQFLEERQTAALERQRGELASALLASLSHDLKTPLTVIRTAIENLRDDRAIEVRHAQAETAIAELNRLTRLFDDLLDMARIDAAAMNVKREWVTPADVVDNAIAHVRHAVEDHKLQVDAQDSVAVNIDARLTAIALSHLLTNAARYSPADCPILIEGRVQPDGVRFTVTDHGPGLDPAELGQLFERFYRGREVRHTTQGTGMGLAIARGLLNAIGGRVWAENAPGTGARFSMVVDGATRAVKEGA